MDDPNRAGNMSSKARKKEKCFKQVLRPRNDMRIYVMEANANNIYWIDKDMKIVAVSVPWNEFAEKNNRHDVVSERVRGKHAWEFITEDTTRMWFDALIQLARVKRAPIERPYRCDSPPPEKVHEHYHYHYP